MMIRWRHALSLVATATSICMYVSYLPQIMANLAGHKANPIQPLSASINCLLWVGYAVFQPKTDYPLLIANLPGVFLGAITFVTAIW